MSPQPPQVLHRFSHLRHLWDIGLGLIHAINNNAQVLVWLVASLLSMLVVLLSLCTIVSKCLFNFIAITCSGSLLHVTCITCSCTYDTCSRCLLQLASSCFVLSLSPQSFRRSSAYWTQRSHLLNRLIYTKVRVVNVSVYCMALYGGGLRISKKESYLGNYYFLEVCIPDCHKVLERNDVLCMQSFF